MMMSSLLINKRYTGMGKYVDINVGMYEKYGLHFVRDPNKLRAPFVRTRKSYGFHSDKIRRIYGFSKYVTRNAMGSGSYGLRVNSGRVQNGSGSDTGCGALIERGELITELQRFEHAAIGKIKLSHTYIESTIMLIGYIPFKLIHLTYRCVE